MKLGRDQLVTVCLLFAITAVALYLRLWHFRECCRLNTDEAIFANMSAALFLPHSIFGWENVFRFRYGVGMLFVMAAWEKTLIHLGFPFDEKTMHLPEILFGILLIWVVYGWIKRLVSKGPALMTAALVGVIPMFVILSRTTLQWALLTLLVFAILYFTLLWCARDRWYLALWNGLLLGVYIQSDGLQLFFIPFLPILLWLLADQKATRVAERAVRWSGIGFSFVLFLAGALLHPAILRFILPGHIARWTSAALLKVEVDAWVIMGYSVILFSLITCGAYLRLPSKLNFVWRKISNPWFLIPVSTSFLVVLLVAVGAWIETGTPGGVLGYAFNVQGRTHQGSILGFYPGPWIQDLVAVWGIPVMFLVAIGLALIPLSVRRVRAIVILGILAFITNVPWLFVVSPRGYGEREVHMLVASCTLLSLSVCSLWCGLDRFRGSLFGKWMARYKPIVLGSLVSFVCFCTLPLTFAIVKQTPVWGMEPQGRYWYGTVQLARGKKESFKYVSQFVRGREKVFSNFNRHYADYYLQRPYGRKYRGRVIASTIEPNKSDPVAVELLRHEGREADWYVVSKEFSQKYSKEFHPRMGLRAVADGSSGSTEVWQRNYQGGVEFLPVCEPRI